MPEDRAIHDTVSYEVRPARLGDLLRVSQLESRVWRELAVSYEDLKRRFTLFPQGFIVASAGAEILGFCSAFLTDQDARTTELTESFPPRHVPRGQYFFLFGLTVDPVFRRKGIGQTLVREELAVAKKMGCRKVQLVANSLSRSLFENLGFRAMQPVATLFLAHRDLMPDPVLMERQLP